MKILGIIAEYNPFHYGHLYHLNKSIKLIEPDYTIAVMSGNFTQRGEAAIVDKWIRAKTAIKNGIDLVIELPVVYAVQTAEIFAYGAIQTLNYTGLITHLSFGSEIESIDLLKSFAQILTEESALFQSVLKKYLAQGISFPAARNHAIHKCLEANNFTDCNFNGTLGSNTILAIEYLKALQKTNSHIEPILIHRISSKYNSKEIKKGITSATSIRKELYDKGFSDKIRNSLPASTFNILANAFNNNQGPVFNDSFDNLMIGIIRRSSLSEIENWQDINEGLQYRIKNNASITSSIDELLESLKTKRYVGTRLQRILVHGLLNITKDATKSYSKSPPKYLRILAFSSKALPLLRELKKTAKVPIITKAAHIKRNSEPTQEMFQFDCLATDMYSLGIKNSNFRKAGRDFTQNIFMQ